MTELDQLLEVDNDNIGVSTHNLRAVAPRSLELIELCACALKHLFSEYGGVCGYDDLQERLEVASTKIPGYGLEMLNHIYDSVLIGQVDGEDPVGDAHKVMLAELNIMSRVMLCLRVGREFMFSMSDLLRLRVSSSLGVLRTQAETVALIRMLGQDQDLGRQWLATIDD